MKNEKKPDFFKIKISWWFFLFIILCLFSYNQAIQKKKEEIAFLEKKRTLIEKEKETLLEQKEDLMDRIASKDDPDWIEQVLMKKLGVVPKGYMKVYFKKEKS